jgi:protein-L-isoaspartate O-methyltransferase
MFELKRYKTEKYSLTEEFLSILKNDLNIKTFIETGTYLGETTLKASEIFDEVHSIELSKSLYDKAKTLFKNKINIKLYYGDSKNILPIISKNNIAG